MIVTRFAWIAHKFLYHVARQPACLSHIPQRHSRVFEHVHEERFRRLLQRQDRRRLPPQSRVPVVNHVGHHVQRDLAHLYVRSVSHIVPSQLFHTMHRHPVPLLVRRTQPLHRPANTPHTYEYGTRTTSDQRLLTTRENGSLRMSSSVLFWYLRISRSATVPGRNRFSATCPH